MDMDAIGIEHRITEVEQRAKYGHLNIIQLDLLYYINKKLWIILQMNIKYLLKDKVNHLQM